MFTIGGNALATNLKGAAEENGLTEVIQRLKAQKIPELNNL